MWLMPLQQKTQEMLTIESLSILLLPLFLYLLSTHESNFTHTGTHTFCYGVNSFMVNVLHIFYCLVLDCLVKKRYVKPVAWWTMLQFFC